MSIANRICDWNIVCSEDAFLAPECRAAIVVGRLKGVPEGEPSCIRTSRVSAFWGRSFMTESGSLYVLEGEPDGAFIARMDANGVDIDLDRPFIAPFKKFLFSLTSRRGGSRACTVDGLTSEIPADQWGIYNA